MLSVRGGNKEKTPETRKEKKNKQIHISQIKWELSASLSKFVVARNRLLLLIIVRDTSGQGHSVVL